MIQDQLKKNITQDGNIVVGILFFGNSSNIEYSSQIKEKIEKINNFTISKQAIAFVASLKKVNTKITPKFFSNLTEANYITNKNETCNLIITEGQSASNLFKEISQTIVAFFNNNGLLSLKGKIQNVQKVNLTNNVELLQINTIMGFQDEQVYTQELIGLRYKKIIIATDYDVDGFHIKGLFINFLHQFHPELLSLDFLYEFRTPIITCTYISKDIKEFYSEYDYDLFIENLGDAQKKQVKNQKYYKGLGSFNQKEAAEIGISFDRHLKKIEQDMLQPEVNKNIVELFGKDSEQRKKLIKEYTNEQTGDLTNQPIKLSLIFKQVILYSQESLFRAIPDFMDGLKDCQRKIIYHVYKCIKPNTTIKVNPLSGQVQSLYCYHHGETSLQDTIVKLAQNYPGSNNYNLLKNEGLFGNRFDCNNSSSRYIKTGQNTLINFIFKKEDNILLTYRKSDEEEDIEPFQMFPIIPLQLLNGANGIASGYSTFIPNYDMLDICNYIKNNLNKTKQQKLIPKFNNYIGSININTQEEDIEQMECQGKFEITKTQFIIYDTHIYITIHELQLFLTEHQIQHTLLKGITIQIVSNTTEDITMYKLKSKKDSNITIGNIITKFLYFKKTISQINLITFVKKYNEKQIDYQNTPKLLYFKNIYIMFNTWIDTRLYIYKLRKQKQLEQILLQYIYQYNINNFVQQRLYNDIEKKQIITNKLQIFVPENLIPSILKAQQTLSELKVYLQQQTKSSVYQELTEYKYILDNTITYFINYKSKLQILEEEYNQLFILSINKMWINELDLLKEQYNKYIINFNKALQDAQQKIKKQK